MANNAYLSCYKRNKELVVSKAKEYYKSNKERLSKQEREKYNNLPEEEKVKKREYRRNKYCLISKQEENKRN